MKFGMCIPPLGLFLSHQYYRAGSNSNRPTVYTDEWERMRTIDALGKHVGDIYAVHRNVRATHTHSVCVQLDWPKKK